MRAERWWRAWRAVALAGLVITCKGTEDPTGSSLDAPTELVAETVGMRSVRLTWRASHSQDVAGYEIQRRANLQGEFETIQASALPSGTDQVTFFDVNVEPGTYYGYRVRALNRFGAHSEMTNVAGTKTASEPGISILTSTTPRGAAFLDPDGYTADIRGPRDTTSVLLAVAGQRLIAKPRGTYTVVLRGLANNCALQTAADSMKTATVNDEGIQTVAALSFAVSCQDPTKGSIVVVHSTTGDTLDADGLVISVAGIIGNVAPPNERVYSQTRTAMGRSSATRFDNLWPGDYNITVSDIDPPCTLDGERVIAVVPKPLHVDTVKFAVTCRKPDQPPDTVGRPFVLRHTWSSSTVRPGDKVSLLTSIDVSAQPSQEVMALQGQIQLDNTVVRYDSTARSDRSFDITAVNQAAPGVILFAVTTSDGTGRTGNVDVMRTWYTVVGTNNSTEKTVTEIVDVIAPPTVSFKDKVYAAEASITISNTAPPPNQPPTGRITGPTTGNVGASLPFSGSTSSDPDGTIASYAWTFGDNGTGTGASASHTYSVAGTYTVRLTVTDDKGATGSTESSVTIIPASPTTGTIAGTVTSPQRGALSGVMVSYFGGTATTDASGAYALTNVPTGTKTLFLSNLPSDCTTPPTQTATVPAGGTVTVNFTVTCTATPTTGTVTGTITKSTGGNADGVQVTLTPTGGSALPAVTTSATGAYSIANVPTAPGTGNITLANVPAGCTNPGPTAYTGLTTSGLTANITLTCTAGVFTYPVTATWGPITNTGPTGRQVMLTLAIDMGAAPGLPDVAGADADPLVSIALKMTYDRSKISYQSRTALTDELNLVAANQPTPDDANCGSLCVSALSSSGSTKTGAFQFVSLTFNIVAGASGSVAPVMTVKELLVTLSQIDKTANAAVQQPPPLIIP